MAFKKIENSPEKKRRDLQNKVVSQIITHMGGGDACEQDYLLAHRIAKIAIDATLEAYEKKQEVAHVS